MAINKLNPQRHSLNSLKFHVGSIRVLPKRTAIGLFINCVVKAFLSGILVGIRPKPRRVSNLSVLETCMFSGSCFCLKPKKKITTRLKTFEGFVAGMCQKCNLTLIKNDCERKIRNII